jgi:YD repeat-containing protein
VRQAVNALTNGAALENNFSYDNDRIAAINHNGTVYGFTYNAWGQMTAAKVGAQTLASYDYDAGGQRNLGKITYGNGDSVTYQYNTANQITKISLDNGATWAYTYTYDGNQFLREARDIAAGTKWIYGYNETELRKISDDSLLYTVKPGETAGQLVENFLGRSFTYHKAETETDDGTGITTAEQTVSGAANYTVTASADWFGRTLEKGVTFGQNAIETAYGYTELPDDRVTSQIERLTNKINGTVQADYVYSYDTKGNITQITNGNDTTAYTYDEAGQLTSETQNGLATNFAYDKGGNIVQKGADSFIYDSVWTDKLIAVNNTPLTYDPIGNPTQIGATTLTWQGRQLASYGTNTYTYNENGLRTSKTVGGVTTEYFWSGDTLIGQKSGNDAIFFNGVGFNHNGTQYYYVKNLQGDVTAVLLTR